MIDFVMETQTPEEPTVPTNTNKGGKRIGAGRPPVLNRVMTASISMRPAHWEKLDRVRGEQSRSAWMRNVIETHDSKPES